MPGFRYRRFFAVAMCLAALSGFCREAPAEARRNPPAVYPATFSIPILLKPIDTRSLADALRSVAAQAKVAFVVEGAPYHPSSRPLLPKDLTTSYSTPQVDQSLGIVVDDIGAYYGYRIEDCDDRTRTITLTKTYDDPSDLPDVTPEELQHSICEMLRITGAFNPAKPFFFDPDSPLAARLRHDWDTPRFDRMRLKTGMPVEDLSPDWQDRFSAYVLQCYIGRPMQALRRCQADSERALRDGSDSYVQEALADEKVDSKNDIPRKRSDHDAAGDRLSDHETAGVTTLGALADALNRQPSAHGFAAEDSLREKHLLIVGSEYTSAEALFRAAAAVYGLRCLRPTEDSPFTITYHRPSVARDVLDVPQSVEDLLPAPLMRIHDREYRENDTDIEMNDEVRDEDDLRAILDPDSPDVAERTKQRDAWERTKPRKRLSAVESRTKTIALRRLRLLLAPENVYSRNERTDVSSDVEKRRLLNVCLSMDTLSVLDGLIDKRPPTYVTDFAHDCVCGKIVSAHDDGIGEKRLALFIYNNGRRGFSRTEEESTPISR